MAYANVGRGFPPGSGDRVTAAPCLSLAFDHSAVISPEKCIENALMKNHCRPSSAVFDV